DQSPPPETRSVRKNQLAAATAKTSSGKRKIRKATIAATTVASSSTSSQKRKPLNTPPFVSGSQPNHASSAPKKTAKPTTALRAKRPAVTKWPLRRDRDASATRTTKTSPDQPTSPLAPLSAASTDRSASTETRIVIPPRYARKEASDHGTRTAFIAPNCDARAGRPREPGDYQPRVSSRSSGASPAAESPLIASPRPCETRASTSASR